MSERVDRLRNISEQAIAHDVALLNELRERAEQAERLVGEEIAKGNKMWEEGRRKLEHAKAEAQSHNIRANEAEHALSDTLVKLEESVQSIVQLRAALADSHRQIEYLHETMQAREATLAHVEGERDISREILHKIIAERDGLREEVEKVHASNLMKALNAATAEANGLREQLASSVRDVKAVLETNHGLREENKRLRAVDCEALGQHQVCDHVIDQLNGLRKEIEGWEQDSLKDKAIINGLRAALERAHACATLQDDGTCAGCFVSAALGQPGKEST